MCWASILYKAVKKLFINKHLIKVLLTLSNEIAKR